jgi:hypothetical protein
MGPITVPQGMGLREQIEDFTRVSPPYRLGSMVPLLAIG